MGSILNDTKKALGMVPEYKAFDPEITMFINTVFSTLHQLGVGPEDGFSVEDDTTQWDAFLSTNQVQLNTIKTYVGLKTRMLFDPPTTSYLKDSLEKQIEQLEWRISVRREEETWIPPTVP